MHIQDKVIMITGASSGIGEATALLLASEGCRVVLGARHAGKLAALAQRINDAGGQAVHASIDVRRHADLSAIVALAVERFGKLDVCVNNAGIGPLAPLDALRVDEWNEMIDVNVKGVLNGIAAALPVFRRQGFGHVINLCSTAAYRVVPNMAVYCATKSAVRAISEGLRQEAGEHLRVTVVSPGFTRTNFAESIADADAKAPIVAAMEKIAMPPAAIANAIAFAIAQPDDIDVGEVIVRPTAQG
ncbi:SDR family oxidoreductase [Massilia sp. YIM B02443]|uniref:SDR family oxidoreductase n=1 Tax=Massilia sp. YIM B02443 TaxID=3050127 RepID=UPI0025B63D6B|nr:SDR family oxidoreductase [Massilia sp. YIM B02443]MDN4036110.1 SDR family oxidoreductase [Massilia sp. YIM B02443]